MQSTIWLRSIEPGRYLYNNFSCACVCVRVRVVQNFDQTMAPLAAASDPQAEAESKLSLHFNLTDIKSALTDVRERMDEIRTGNTRSRGSLGSSNALNH